MSNTQPQDPQTLTINRTLVAIIALCCLAIAIGLRFGLPHDDRKELWVTGFGRAGLIMCALWIALPSKGRSAAWSNVSPMTVAGALLALIAVSARPQIILRMLPVFAALGAIAYFLRPRPTRRDERPDRRTWK